MLWDSCLQCGLAGSGCLAAWGLRLEGSRVLLRILDVRLSFTNLDVVVAIIIESQVSKSTVRWKPQSPTTPSTLLGGQKLHVNKRVSLHLLGVGPGTSCPVTQIRVV